MSVHLDFTFEQKYVSVTLYQHNEAVLDTVLSLRNIESMLLLVLRIRVILVQMGTNKPF